MQNNKYIGFCGMSHLGLNYLAAASSKKFNVIGFDKDEEHISNLKKNLLKIKEPGLEYTLKKNKKNIKFTSNLEDLKKCNLIFISLDINTNQKNESNYNEINKLLKSILSKLNHKFTLVLLSQVFPGFTRKILNKKTDVFYQVETLIFGSALKCAKNPARIIIGSNSKFITQYYKNYLNKFKCEKILTSLETAEFTKIAINLYLISNLTLTNTLNKISYDIGVIWEDVKRSLKLDKRIGKYSYLNPGLGIASGNLERDLSTISNFSNKTDHSKDLFDLWKRISVYHENWILRKMENIQVKNKFINILGITYKPKTNSLKNSVAIKLIKKFNKINFIGFDPEIKKKPKIKNLFLCDKMDRNFIKSDTLIIATNHKLFYEKKFRKLLNFKKIKNVIDPFGIIKIKDKKIKYQKI